MNIFGPILLFIISLFPSSGMDVDPVRINKLASEQISLEKRYSNEYVNNVFKDNILLNMAYLSGKVTKKEEIDWNEVVKPFSYRFVLLKGQTFAFHEDVLPKYKDSLVKTTNARFNYDDGFKFSGALVGDGVCHLASLIYWVAKDAGLEAYAPVNHDFSVIPEIDRKYGVAIYKMPGNISANALQNLYITNNRKNNVIFEFDYKNEELRLTIYETENISDI